MSSPPITLKLGPPTPTSYRITPCAFKLSVTLPSFILKHNIPSSTVAQPVRFPKIACSLGSLSANKLEPTLAYKSDLKGRSLSAILSPKSIPPCLPHNGFLLHIKSCTSVDIYSSNHYSYAYSAEPFYLLLLNARSILYKRHATLAGLSK